MGKSEVNKTKDTILSIINITIAILLYALMGASSVPCMEGIEGIGTSVLCIVLYINMLVAMLIQTILHEAGHLIAGLLSGYEYSSFRILSWVWVKDNDKKLHIKKMKIKGTAGQCLMCPPKLPIENSPYMLYHLGGGLMNLVVGGVCIILYQFVLPQEYLTFLLFEEFGIVGIVLGLTNLIPCKTGGIQNDGYNLLDLRKNIEIRKCMNMVLSINAYLTLADSYAELPKELVDEIKSVDFTKMDITNGSILNAYNYQAALYFAEENYEEAYRMQKHILDTKGTLEIFRNEARCECLFYELTHGQDKETIEKLYNKKLQKYIQTTAIYPSRMRLMFAYYYLYEKNDKKAQEMYTKLERAVDTYMIKADALMELAAVKKLKSIYMNERRA